jgi:hypothetical protein
MNDQSTERGRDACQLRRAIHPRIVNVETNGHTTAGHSVAQAIERGIESLAGIKLRMGDQPAGVVESGVQKHLHAAALLPLDPRPEQHVSLPDLIAEFGFELLMRLWGEQLLFREATLFQEAI